MRKPEYLSPTSRSLYRKDKKEFYLSYLSENRTPRFPQTQPMSIGSSFDAYCKSAMHFAIFGNFGKDNQFEFKSIFESQVEAHNRDWALAEGAALFNLYKESGAFKDLLSEVAKGVGEPRFEATLTARVGVSEEFEGVTVLGKPDLVFRNHTGCPITVDWKVNGYCSANNTSPMKGYVKLRDKGASKAHKDCVQQLHRGIIINITHRLEELNDDWAAQLATYSWVTGEQPGTEFVAWVEQLVGNPARMATHRMLVSPAYQLSVLEDYKKIWKAIQTGWIFDEMTREENDALCLTLDGIGSNYKDMTPADEWFNSVTRVRT